MLCLWLFFTTWPKKMSIYKACQLGSVGHVRIGFTWLSALKKELSEDRVNSSVHIAGKISQVNNNEKSNYKKKIKKNYKKK